MYYFASDDDEMIIYHIPSNINVTRDQSRKIMRCSTDTASKYIVPIEHLVRLVKNIPYIKSST
jgi:hypothetical protein